MMNLFDSHVSFWNPPALYYAWMRANGETLPPFTPTEFKGVGVGWQVSALMAVQAECLPEQGIKEVQWFSQLARQDARIEGIIAYAPLENHNFHAYLEVIQKEPKVRGVRRPLSTAELALAEQEHFIDALRNLPDYDFSFDLMLPIDALSTALILVQQCADTQFIWNFVGSPPPFTPAFDEWRAAVMALGTFDKVACKVMLGTPPAEGWDLARQKLIFDVLLQAFGVERLLFGGGGAALTVPTQPNAYAANVDALRALLLPLPLAQQEAIFSQNARQLYQLRPDASAV